MSTPDKRTTGGRRTHLQTHATPFDGEYDMTGDSNTILELTTKITEKAKRTLNPFNKQDIQFDEEWKYYKDSKGKKSITRDEFLERGGIFEYIAWSNYAGGNRFEISGRIFKGTRVWVFNGYGRFS